MEKPDPPSPTVLSFPDLAEPPAAGSLANKRLLESRGAEDGPEADESLKVVGGDEPRPRTMQRRVRKVRADEAALRTDVVRLASRFGRYGYRRITNLLRRVRPARASALGQRP